MHVLTSSSRTAWILAAIVGVAAIGMSPGSLPARAETVPGWPAPTVVLRFDCDAFVQPDQRVALDLTAGTVVGLTLCSNPSTGFAWAADIADPAVLAGAEVASSPPPSPMPGAPSIQAFQVLAQEPGVTVVDLAYRQPWEGGMVSPWNVHLDIEVMPPGE